eukprot:3004582-Pleurochrysis_carterae.AAC.1
MPSRNSCSSESHSWHLALKGEQNCPESSLIQIVLRRRARLSTTIAACRLPRGSCGRPDA